MLGAQIIKNNKTCLIFKVDRFVVLVSNWVSCGTGLQVEKAGRWVAFCGARLQIVHGKFAPGSCFKANSQN